MELLVDRDGESHLVLRLTWGEGEEPLARQALAAALYAATIRHPAPMRPLAETGFPGGTVVQLDAQERHHEEVRRTGSPNIYPLARTRAVIEIGLAIRQFNRQHVGQEVRSVSANAGRSYWDRIL